MTTTPTLEAELAELLPCYCDYRGHCAHCRARPAVLAFIQRKLDEARADSELLEKVEQMLRAPGSVELTIYERMDRTIGVVYSDEGPNEGQPTLRDALRKLVEEKP